MAVIFLHTILAVLAVRVSSFSPFQNVIVYSGSQRRSYVRSTKRVGNERRSSTVRRPSFMFQNDNTDNSFGSYGECVLSNPSRVRIQVASTGSRVLHPEDILDVVSKDGIGTTSLHRRRTNGYLRIPQLDDYEYNSVGVNGNCDFDASCQQSKARALPLQRAIHLMTSAVQTIVHTLERGIQRGTNHQDQFVTDISVLQDIDLLLAETNHRISSPLFKLSSSRISGNNITDKSRNSCFFTIRIEQDISHPVDPLCWLHANVPSSISPVTHNIDPPILYLGNAEDTLEVAAYGSSLTIRDLLSSEQKQGENKSPWTLINNLPWGSRVYGGSRFDNSRDITISPEWQDFGHAFWFLPAIELRRELEKVHSPSLQFTNHISSEHSSTHRDDSINGIHSPSGTSSSSTSSTTDREPHGFQSNTTQGSRTTLSIHLHFSCPWTLLDSARNVRRLLQRVTHRVSTPMPTTTLPSIVSRGANDVAQEVFERGVQCALDLIHSNETLSDSLSQSQLTKVVLARKADLCLGADVSGLDIMMKLKFGRHVGHLFFLFPGCQTIRREFFGCTPERLFQVNSYTGKVTSEALAGTRPRGSTPDADSSLLQDLIHSEKDRSENRITAGFITSVFSQLRQLGLIKNTNEMNRRSDSNHNDSQLSSAFFVRRLRHLQHICQSFEETLVDSSSTVDVANYLIDRLHPTPAVCGFPALRALQFIQSYESKHFDRGYYAGPFGHIGRDSVDVLVAIRSALLSRAGAIGYLNNDQDTAMSVYAGAGIVSGSTTQGEWSETSYKIEVLSSLFSQSPFSLQTAANANVAWATSFVEELIRCGITQFYICPGSRSTPLTAAIAKAMRLHTGTIHAISVHDERVAAFRALGYGRASGRPAVVVTSSGTAVANLYPAVMEAGLDGIPIILLTADRPYENRDNGSNQSVDQIKVFSSTYVRWFRDLAPPTDDIPISVALSDANHAVLMASNLMGPVHLNLQFRENLAPESGNIRGDNRIGSVSSFSHSRFSDAPGFKRWSVSGKRITEMYRSNNNFDTSAISPQSAARDVALLISRSKRGIIIVGSIRGASGEKYSSYGSAVSATIAEFAEFTGLPIFAGAQSSNIRFQSPMVVSFAEYVLKHPKIRSNLNPDLIVQIGSTLVSTELPNLITETLKTNGRAIHLLIHPHHPAERNDPTFTCSYKISSETIIFLELVRRHLDELGVNYGSIGSDLLPLISLGRALGHNMPNIIHKASAVMMDYEGDYPSFDSISKSPTGQSPLSEPQIILAMSEVLAKQPDHNQTMALFLSNSMPVRDAELFLYPHDYESGNLRSKIATVAVNRGASGIDGIMSTSTGFTEGLELPTTVLIGDLATIHDLNSFHNLVGYRPTVSSSRPMPPITTIIVNNNGGAIFSFLPIAKFGSDVGFEDFFGTPTNSFSFKKGIEAFGLQVKTVATFDDFKTEYLNALANNQHSAIEACVTGRSQNVRIHTQIAKLVTDTLETIIMRDNNGISLQNMRLPIKSYGPIEIHSPVKNIPLMTSSSNVKNLVLLHGWMGTKNDWDKVGKLLIDILSPEWRIISIDLPGHGDSPFLLTNSSYFLQEVHTKDVTSETIESLTQIVINSLIRDHDIHSIDAICGYSLGGRIALEMRRLSILAENITGDSRYGFDSPSYVGQPITRSTKVVLLGADPGIGLTTIERETRKKKDINLASQITMMHNKLSLSLVSPREKERRWTSFLEEWYDVPIWGDLKSRKPEIYQAMVRSRLASLKSRASDIARVLQACSPARSPVSEFDASISSNVYFVAGSLDEKYSAMGRQLSSENQGIIYSEIENVGHALLFDAPLEVANIVSSILKNDRKDTLDLVPDALSSVKNSHESEQSVLQLKIATTNVSLVHFDFERFAIKLGASSDREKGLLGIGWGEKAKENTVKERRGFILSLVSGDSSVGLGEASPFDGVHPETFEEVEDQLNMIRDYMKKSTVTLIPPVPCEKILALNGSLEAFIEKFWRQIVENKPIKLLPSIRSGLEMSLLSLASYAIKVPLFEALSQTFCTSPERRDTPDMLPLNGLITRDDISTETKEIDNEVMFPSIKVKVGKSTVSHDAERVWNARNQAEKVRADANRSWNESTLVNFATSLKEIHPNAITFLEFVEEPLQKRVLLDDRWTLAHQVNALESLFGQTGIKYALDESLADAVIAHDYKFNSLSDSLRSLYIDKKLSGCAALILKPSLLGLELSMRLAQLAHEDLKIGAVFSSAFDSGVGLAYATVLAAVSDLNPHSIESTRYAHGLSTFNLLGADTLSPPYKSFVTKNGAVDVLQLSRALYSLTLEDMRDSFSVDEPNETQDVAIDGFKATSLSSNTGRELSVQVSLQLPFSDDIAYDKFTDLPQQPRWSPWLKSVSYLGGGEETEWTLNIRGIQFRWQAKRELLTNPKGVMWESTSGLKNKGLVEFVKTSDSSCLMKLKMKIIVPRIIASVFQSTGEFVKDFVQDKLLKWSLQSFRDVVKADLALQRGDAELGDALFGAVEGRSHAIIETLSN